MGTGFTLVSVPPYVWRVRQYSDNILVHEETFGPQVEVLKWLMQQYLLREAQANFVQECLIEEQSTGPYIRTPALDEIRCGL